MGQHVPRHPAHRATPPRAVLKWIGVVATGTLFLGTAPATGQLAPGSPALTATVSASTSIPVVSPVYAIPDSTPLLGDADATTWAETWSPGYQPDVRSEVSPDGSARNGEGVSRSGGALHVATGPSGLLPGGLALSAPVSSTRITSAFGWRLNPTGPGSYIHIGQDYGVACGTPVRAAEDGTVIQSAWAGHSGQRVRVDHGSGVETAYSHNSLLVARVGDTVRRGDLLALSGTTGNSTGCHLHFEVYLNGKWVDPAQYLPRLPGQVRPVTEAERQRIARTRALPADHVTAASSTEPDPTSTKQTPSPPADSAPSTGGTESAANTSTSAAPTTRPRVPTAAAKPPVHSTPTPSAPTPPSPPRPTPAPPSQTPSASPTHRPAPPTASSPATPTATPTPKPTTPPSATPTPTPSETPAPPSTTPAPKPTENPSPTPTPGTPTPDPETPVSTPPSLASLCLAFQQEDQEAASGPDEVADRPLSTNELAWLDSTLAADLPKTDRLPEDPTVHQVTDLCPTWFPDGIADDTVAADLEVLAATPVPTRPSKDSTK